MVKATKCIIGILVVCSVLFNSTGCSELKVEHRPNLVLILADDQGLGATSIRMNPLIRESFSDFIRIPNFERLASVSVTFTSGYAPHSNCSPSRAAILTGKTPAKPHLTDISLGMILDVVEEPGITFSWSENKISG